MKKILFMCVLLAGNALYAQENSEPLIKHNAIKVNLLSPIFNTVNLSYQRILTPERSMQFGISYMDFDDFRNIDDNYTFYGDVIQNNVKGVNLILDYKVNFSGYGLNGFYAGPFLRYMIYERNFERFYNGTGPTSYTEKANYQSAGIGFLFGKQYLFKNTITLDLYAGPVYQVLVSEKRTNNLNNGSYTGNRSPGPDYYLGNSISNLYIKGYSLRAGFNIGFAF